MLAIVTGMIATYPVGGVVWDYGQYALGLQRLGFEVYYLEDTGMALYSPEQGVYGEEYSFNVRYLADALSSLSPALGQRWHLRTADKKTFGVDAKIFEGIVAQADLFLNVSGSCLLRDNYIVCPRKVLIDTDPGRNHFINYPKWDSEPEWRGTHAFRAHDHYFTYAENLGHAACSLPNFGLDWHPTRPPVIMDCWRPVPPGVAWTTVMTWNNFRRPIVHKGVIYGAKELEFTRIEALPGQCNTRLEVAVGGNDAPRERWRRLGWSVLDSHQVSATPEAYRKYIESSRGELSVAKNMYVATHSGWFSCRSVCYLAAGRPVVIQDTGFSDVIPTGHGLLAFSNLEQAAQALQKVESDYTYHQEAARELARTCFDAEAVLGELLHQIGLE